MADIGNSSITVETISDIALEKLKNDMTGFYSIDFLLPSLDKPTLKAEAGISLGEWMKLTLWGCGQKPGLEMSQEDVRAHTGRPDEGG